MSRKQTTGLRPGQQTPTSGQYERVGPRGGKVPGEITSTEGNPLPPSLAAGQTYKLVDPTRHKRRK
jgi:hypothetical protein